MDSVETPWRIVGAVPRLTRLSNHARIKQGGADERTFYHGDELSTWGLGAYGGAVHTPEIDRLAKRGRRFDAAYTPSPICVPTRAAIATGRYLGDMGAYWDSVQAYDGRIPSWGHLLQAAGAPVVSIGKLHYKNRAAPTGFDEQIEPLHILNGVGWPPSILRDELPSYDSTHMMAQEIGQGESSYTAFDRRVADEACRWLDAAPDKPWCAFVSFLSPHYPLIAPPEHFAKYDPKALESAAAPLPGHPLLDEGLEFWDHDRHFTPKTRGVARAAYFGLCSFLDEMVGRVLARLEANGLADDTLVILTSDHGELLGEKRYWGKSLMYDSAARVPLILAGPGVALGEEPAPVNLIDIAPTICAAHGLEADFPGADLRGPADPDRTVLSEYHDGGFTIGMTMVRWRDWKYVHYAQGHDPQLFDLAADPKELTDLSAQRPDIVQEARRRLSAFFDPEAVDAQAHADQARLVEEMGGRDQVLASPSFEFTPADSR